MRSMAANKWSPQRVGATLGDFLFARIRDDAGFQTWAKTFEIPSFITDNLHPSKQLRPYQEEAVKYFIYLFESGDREACKHLLFNMATGTGKTLVMACVILYLYERGYRHFVFLVHQVQILTQARKNFTEYGFDKYLFHPNGISFNGRKVRSRCIESFEEANANDINIMFLSTSLFYNRIREDGENRLCAEDFATRDVVIIADEAHRLNVETRKTKSATEEEEVLNWESAVMGAISARPSNMLIEFTATVDLSNRNIHAKYRDKLVYKYDFLDFNRAGYCKDVQFLYNNETQVEDQKRLLIVHAVALSQYRKILFRLLVGVEIHPVILVKSRRIADSEADREFFHSVISDLSPRDFDKLRQTENDENHLISNIFGELSARRISIEQFIADIRHDFSDDYTIIYNSKEKTNASCLTGLDSSKNLIRAIFSVNALNEWWDVLSLFDIIHFDIGADKKVSLQDIQLIGRGARYCPFSLPENFQIGGLFGSYESVRDKRKFDQVRYESARILETFFYHFVKTGMFLENLQQELMGEGIISEWVERRTIRLKSGFLESDTWQNGFVLINRTEKRTRTTDEEREATFDKVLKVSSYTLRSRGLTNREENTILADIAVGEILIVRDFSRHILYKALVRAENGFFRFGHLREHLPDIEGIDEFIDSYLSRYSVTYQYERGKDIEHLDPYEKLQLLVGVILPEIRKVIDRSLPKVVGSTVFRPVSISQVFEQEKNLHFISFPIPDPLTGEVRYTDKDKKAIPQSEEKLELALDISKRDWYAYDESYGTSEEKKFVKFIDSKVWVLRSRYPWAEIFLVRNELDYWVFAPKSGKRFSPDFLLFINDVVNKKLYYQCIFEVKWGHLLEIDSWKEEAILDIDRLSEVSLVSHDDGWSQERRSYLEWYSEIKNIGYSFYNSEMRDTEFRAEFDEKMGIE